LPNSVLSHTNEPSTEEPSVNPLATVGEEGNNEQSIEEPPGDPLTTIREEGNNEQSTEEPPGDPLTTIGEEGNNEQATEEPPGDPLTNFGEEGNISGPSYPVRTRVEMGRCVLSGRRTYRFKLWGDSRTWAPLPVPNMPAKLLCQAQSIVAYNYRKICIELTFALTFAFTFALTHMMPP
jgi:hypothetical protein